METDNIADVDEFFRWTEVSLQQLALNLRGIGYEFSNQEGPFGKVDSNDNCLLKLERKYGRIPHSYRVLYSTFRFIDFSQAEQQLRAGGSDISGLGLNCPLVFISLDSIDCARSELLKCGVSVEVENRHFLPTGAAASNCDPKGIWVPELEVDPVLYNEGAGPVSLMKELREAVLAGGFPFWKRMFQRKRHSSPLGHSPAYSKLLPELLRGIEPPPQPTRTCQP